MATDTIEHRSDQLAPALTCPHTDRWQSSGKAQCAPWFALTSLYKSMQKKGSSHIKFQPTPQLVQLQVEGEGNSPALLIEQTMRRVWLAVYGEL
jgi:hypothetical protein